MVGEHALKVVFVLVGIFVLVGSVFGSAQATISASVQDAINAKIASMTSW